MLSVGPALLEDHDTMFDVRSRERCTALRLNAARLCTALRNDPVLAAELFRRALQLTARRLHATEIRLGELCGVRTKTREEGPAEVIRALNKLIETCLDGELGYRTAAEHIAIQSYGVCSLPMQYGVPNLPTSCEPMLKVLAALLVIWAVSPRRFIAAGLR